MAINGDVQIIILDGGSAINVPANQTQVVFDTSSQGTINQIVATSNPNTLSSVFGFGKLPQAAALTCLQGGTVLAMRIPTVTAGTTSAVTKTGTGTSVVTVTGAAYDDAYVIFKVVLGATIGVAGATYQISYDAGRTYGPTYALGTANSLALTDLGVTLAFADGTLVAGDTYQFATIAPLGDTSGIASALTVLRNSTFVNSGWGSMHYPSPLSGANVSTVGTSLETMATNYVFSRLMLPARDASPAAAWGGTGESDSTWSSALVTDFSAVGVKRACVNAGYYNMPSAFESPFAGTPRYRRPLSWALAARHVTIPPQRHEGRVSDGALINIVIDPSSDPTDGFVYHDERSGGGLDVNRFSTARTRIRKPGFFNTNPNLMSPIGSVFTILPLGDVMDVACTIAQELGQDLINQDLILNPNGTLEERQAVSLENDFRDLIKTEMKDVGMISAFTVSVDRTNNVATTFNVNVTISITPVGYAKSVTITLGFSTQQAAPVAGG